MNITWSTFNPDYKSNQVKQNVPKSAGVYLLWVKLKNGNWKCFYAGRAKNLRSRLLEHLGDNEANECLKTKVSKYICGFEYSEVGREDNRAGIEKFLYDTYQPECNINDPGGNPIQVNLPE